MLVRMRSQSLIKHSCYKPFFVTWRPTWGTENPCRRIRQYLNREKMGERLERLKLIRHGQRAAVLLKGNVAGNASNFFAIYERVSSVMSAF